MHFNIKQSIIFCILILALLSLYIIRSQHGEVNRDALMYLTQAQFLVEGNVTKAMEIYDWPFFSHLIAKLHLSSGLTIQHAAHVIDVSLFLIASFFFLRSITLVSNNKLTPIYGLAILLTSIPLMDDYLGMILRDHGQWAGFMLGVYFYLKWVQTPSWFYGAGWQLGFYCGTLFRPECLIFNLLIPFVHPILYKSQQRLILWLQSTSIAWIGLAVAIIYLFFSDASMIDINLTRLNQIILRPKIFILNLLQPLEIETNNHYLKVLLTDFGKSFKYLFLTYVIIFKWITGLGILHLVLFLIAIKQKLISKTFVKPLLLLFLLSAIITIINLYATFVLTNRYWVMNWWIVYLVACFGLHFVWTYLQKLKHPLKKWIQAIFIGVFVIYFLNVIIDKREVHFEQAAGNWVKKSGIDLNNIYFNERRTAFYAGLLAFDRVSLKTAKEVIHYQYLMIRYDRFSQIKNIPGYQPIKHFPSKDNPKVIVYKRIAND